MDRCHHRVGDFSAFSVGLSCWETSVCRCHYHSLPSGRSGHWPRPSSSALRRTSRRWISVHLSESSWTGGSSFSSRRSTSLCRRWWNSAGPAEPPTRQPRRLRPVREVSTATVLHRLHRCCRCSIASLPRRASKGVRFHLDDDEHQWQIRLQLLRRLLLKMTCSQDRPVDLRRFRRKNLVTIYSWKHPDTGCCCSCCPAPSKAAAGRSGDWPVGDRETCWFPLSRPRRPDDLGQNRHVMCCWLPADLPCTEMSPKVCTHVAAAGPLW